MIILLFEILLLTHYGGVVGGGNNINEKYCFDNIFLHYDKKWEEQMKQFPAPCNVSKSFIVLSRGRSGSEYEMEVITRLLTNRTMKGNGEIFGGSGKKMLALHDPLTTMQRYLCPRKHKTNTALYRGFKWKPYVWNEAYIKALLWVGHHDIPVIYNVRNPLDVLLSLKKHKASKMRAHCQAGDAACLEKKMREQIVLLDPSTFIAELADISCLNNYVSFLLDRTKVNYIDVEYETLSFAHTDVQSAIRSWKEVMELINPHADWSDIISYNLLKSSRTVATSSINHRDKIKNYDDAYNSLRGTQFARLIN